MGYNYPSDWDEGRKGRLKSFNVPILSVSNPNMWQPGLILEEIYY